MASATEEISVCAGNCTFNFVFFEFEMPRGKFSCYGEYFIQLD